jgi:hypothetical protein
VSARRARPRHDISHPGHNRDIKLFEGDWRRGHEKQRKTGQRWETQRLGGNKRVIRVVLPLTT